MCPIVPTLTCGLERSNFSFAIAPLLHLDEFPTDLQFVTWNQNASFATLVSHNLSLHGPSLQPGDDLFADRFRCWLVPGKVHGVGGAALRARAHLGGVAEHLRQW